MAHGQVSLWDARARKRPCSVLQGPQNTRALQTLQVAPDGRVVIAGSECGQVCQPHMMLWSCLHTAIATFPLFVLLRHPPCSGTLSPLIFRTESLALEHFWWTCCGAQIIAHCGDWPMQL